MTKHNLSILIPDGESGLALSVIECLSRVSDIKVYVLSSNRWAISRFTRHKIVFIYQEKVESEIKWVDSLLYHVNNLEIDIIFPIDQYAIRALSIHRKLLPPKVSITPLPTTSSFDIAADKWLLAEFMMTNSLPMPDTILIESVEQVERTLSNLIFPVLTKPRNSDGGQGIKYWDNKIKLREFLREHEHPSEIIIQSYVKGYSIDCSVLCRDGVILAYTIQKALLPSTPQFAPSHCIRFTHNREVYKIIEQLIVTLKWSGVAHIDLMYDEHDKRYKILEINPRYWGSLLGSLSAGINFPYFAYLATLNIKFPQPEYLSVLFMGTGIMLGMLCKGTLQSVAQHVKMSDTTIKYLLGDPVPSMIKGMTKLYNQLLRKA
jgi:carbamoylphosphate synthase large subunit